MKKALSLGAKKDGRRAIKEGRRIYNKDNIIS